MNSYSNHSLWFSNQYSHQFYNNPKQGSVMNYSKINHSVSIDYDYYPRYSSISPTDIKPSQSSTYLNESSSGIDMNDEESMERHSSNSEPRVIRFYNSSVPSPPLCSRQVIIKPANRTVKIVTKPRERRTRRKTFLYEKELINRNRSSLHLYRQKHRHSSSERKEDKFKRLYEEYSSENVYREWKPLTFTDTQELYQYALDKYHQKSFSN